MVAVEFGKREKIMERDREQDSKVYIIAHEVKLVRMLAGNDQKVKNKALKSLSQWLLTRSKKMPFTEEDFRRIWKGLFYCMWMSDKPLVQEECAEQISKLVHFPDLSTSLLFFKAGIFILSQEWNGIDQLRLDKFLMLVRRLLREVLRALKQHSFKEKNIESFSEALSETILNKANLIPVGLFMHFNEIFLEELAKVAQGKIHSDSVVNFLKPFIQCLSMSGGGREIGHMQKFIFQHLMRQSNIGLDYQEKYEAWKQQGFPGSIHSMQKVKLDEDEGIEHSDKEEELISSKDPKGKPLDPRAGRVDVDIPQIQFDAKTVAKALSECKFNKKSSSQSRKAISLLVAQFNSLANGVYPLGIKKIDVRDKNEDINVRKAANRLIKFEQKLMGKDRKRKRDKENNEKVNIERKHMKQDNETEVNIKEVKDTSITKKGKEDVNDEHSKNLMKLNDKNKIEKHRQENGENIRATENGTLTTLNNNTEGNLIKNKEKKVKSDRKKRKDVSNNAESTKIKKNKNSVFVNDANKVGSNIIKAKDKVKGKAKDKHLNKQRKSSSQSGDNIECVFERNSGTWVVYEVKKSMLSKKQRLDGMVDYFVSTISPKKPRTSDFKETEVLGTEKSSPNNSASNNFLESPISKDDSPKAGLFPVKLFESPPETKELFQKTAWDEPLQEGEYEICIPMKKYIAKIQKQAKNKNKSLHELINTTLKKIKGKSRLSLDSRLINNPFSKSVSAKKVKINTKLNKSQEVHEHIANVMSSPAIPYDASRKPTKPLLKPTANSTPLNPFYKKQLSMLY